MKKKIDFIFCTFRFTGALFLFLGTSVLFATDVTKYERRTHIPIEHYFNDQVADNSYILGPGDLWEVLAGEMTYRVQVNAEGVVPIEGVGVVPVAGLSLQEGRAKILEALSQRYDKNFLKVTLARQRSFRVPVLGAVQNMIAVDVAPGMLLSHVMAQAEVTSTANLRRVALVRGQDTLWVDLFQNLRTGDLAANPVLRPGDQIFISEQVQSDTDLIIQTKEGELIRLPYWENSTVLDYFQYLSFLNHKQEYERLRILSDNQTEIVDASDLWKVKVTPQMRLEVVLEQRSVYVGGAVRKAGPLPYQASWKPIDYLKEAGTYETTDDIRKVFIIHEDGSAEKVSSIQGVVQPGDYLEVKKSGFEYLKDWTTIVIGMLGVISTVINISIITR